MMTHFGRPTLNKNETNENTPLPPEDIMPVTRCTMLLCSAGSTSHNAPWFYEDLVNSANFH